MLLRTTDGKSAPIACTSGFLRRVRGGAADAESLTWARRHTLGLTASSDGLHLRRQVGPEATKDAETETWESFQQRPYADQLLPAIAILLLASPLQPRDLVDATVLTPLYLDEGDTLTCSASWTCIIILAFRFDVNGSRLRPRGAHSSFSASYSDPKTSEALTGCHPLGM